jgi:DNA polymerase III alpha subunit (gram-positive type)
MTNDARYFLFDCETGGLDPRQYSLLTLFGVVLDSGLNVLDAIDLEIRPNDGEPYKIDPESMALNKIDLTQHNKIAITEYWAKARLRDFFSRGTLFGKNKFIPAGHCVHFDKGFVEKLIGFDEWEKHFSNKVLDTASVARFLFLNGTYKEDPSNYRFEQFLEYLGVPVVNAHNAKADVHATLEALKIMVAKK